MKKKSFSMKDEKAEEVFEYTFDCRDGYMILYALATTDGIPIERIHIDHWADIHSGVTEDVYSKVLFLREYPTPNDFSSSDYDHDRGPWLITLKDGSTISGEKGPVVRVRTRSSRDTIMGFFALIKDRDHDLLRGTGNTASKKQNRDET